MRGGFLFWSFVVKLSLVTMASEANDVHFALRLCEKGDVERLRRLVFNVNASDEDLHTPLQVAAANNQVEAVEYLLALKATVDQPNAAGWTPLHHACLYGHNETIEVLLRAKASVSVANHFGATAVHVTAAGGHVSTLK